jgi:hypothetical protein
MSHPARPLPPARTAARPASVAGPGRPAHPARAARRCARCLAYRYASALLLLAAAAAAWVAMSSAAQPAGKPPAATSPFAAAAQRAAAAASAAAAAASATAGAAEAAASATAAVAGAAASAVATARDAAASATAAPAAAASAVRAAASAVLAGPAGAQAGASGSAAAGTAAAPAASRPAAASAKAAAAGASAPQAPCIQASDGTSFCADTLQLVFKTVALPAGRHGAAYGPRLLVQGGTPPYQLSIAGGKLPAGLELSAEGHLSGVPTAVGLHRFTLAVLDSSTPRLAVQQPYSLRIQSVPPPPAAAPASTPPPAPPRLTAVGKQDAEAVASRLSQTHLRAYKLTADDLKKLATPPEPAEPPAAPEPAPGAALDMSLLDTELQRNPPAAGPAAAAVAAAPPPEPRPTPDQLQDMLASLVDVEYPTRVLFEQAVEARRCAYFNLLVGEAARKQGLANVPPCPTDPVPPGAADASAAASAPARAGSSALAARPGAAPPAAEAAVANATTAAATAATAGAVSKVSALGTSLAGAAAPLGAFPAGAAGTAAPATAAAPAAAPPPAKAASAAAGEIPLDQLYAMLLPPGLKTQITDTALKLHDMAQAKRVQWTGDGCGCAPRQGVNDVYGFYPFWLAQDAEQAIDFSQFTRIAYVGAVLNDEGDYSLPPHWNDQGRHFTRAAFRHGVDVDLVIYRRDWPRLLNLGPEQQEAFIRQAATRAVGLADTPMTDRFSRMKAALLPVWNEPVHLYSGITVFFDDLPTDKLQADKFRGFFRRFMDRLIAEMQRSGRNYALNLVIPDHLLGEEGTAFDFKDLLDYMESAEDGSRSQERGSADKSPDAQDRMHYKGKTDMSMLLLVLMGEPTSPAKKALRARFDNTEVAQGHRRVALLNSVLPVLYHPAGDKPAPLPKPRKDRLDIDLAYIEWQFGGVGFWPVPMKLPDPAMDSVTGVLAANQFLEPGNATLSPLCSRVCPNRSVVRLLFEVLLLVGAVSLGAYAWICEVRRLGPKFLLFLWGGGVATLVVGLALLSCDPDLAALRAGNYLFYALIVALTAGGLYMTFRSRVDPP